MSFKLAPNEGREFLKQISLNQIGPCFVPANPGAEVRDAFSRFMNILSGNSEMEYVFEGGRPASGYLKNYGDFDSRCSFQIHLNEEKDQFSCIDEKLVPADLSYAEPLATHLKQRIYAFKAERLNISSCRMGVDSDLVPNAANLPEVLNLLQTNDPDGFTKFNQSVNDVFPGIKQITVPPCGGNDGNDVEIRVWTHDINTRRKDLAVPLSECGTGIGQVLAILYVVAASNEPRCIIIDEPQSFLNPGALRKLISILKTYPQHQFIIATHSPTIVAAVDPKTLFLVRKDGFESRIESLDISENRQIRIFLSEVGASLADVFGADCILWVEGATEEMCFPLLVERLLKRPLLGVQILGVIQTGDFDGKHSKTIFQIYERLSEGRGLLPPAIGFIFDREGRTDIERMDLERQSKGKVSFLRRVMYENYLLNPEAISAVLCEEDTERTTPVTLQEVKQWLQTNGEEKKYFPKTNPIARNDSQWFEKVNGTEILDDLFSNLTEARISFKANKVRYSLRLTEWITDNAPSDLTEIVDLIKTKLDQA